MTPHSDRWWLIDPGGIARSLLAHVETESDAIELTRACVLLEGGPPSSMARMRRIEAAAHGLTAGESIWPERLGHAKIELLSPDEAKRQGIRIEMSPPWHIDVAPDAVF